MNKIYFGYEDQFGYGFIMTFIFISFIINMIFNVYIFITQILKKTNKNISSFEEILFILSISETLISLFSFISSLSYKNNIEMITDNFEIKGGCKTFGFFQTFLYFFDWVLSGCSVYHLRNMILNPINFILKPFKKIMLYIIISIIISGIITTISISVNIIGMSPYITCFLSINIGKTFKNLIICIFIFTPIYMLIFSIVQYCIIKNNPTFVYDSENRRIFRSYYKYILTNLIIISLIPIPFIIDLINEDSIDENPKWLFFILTLIISLDPLIIGVLRLYEAGLLKICFKNNKQNSKEIESINSPLVNSLDNSIELNIRSLEMSAIKKYIMNIYISVCFCMEKSNFRKSSGKCEINQSVCNETNEYEISKSEILSAPYIVKLFKDKLIKTREDFNITCVEYAPDIFSYLRRLDNVNDEEILESLLPMNNESGIKDSEGKGGSFFLNSDDNEFSIKTITSHEAELIRGELLLRLTEYLSENHDSIIGRIYGMYKISNKATFFKEDDLYFILMKNVIGSFNENLICKYDLKGSSLNRKVKLEEYVQNVMKDNNFRDIEQVLLINKKYAEKLLDISTNDAIFFSSVGIMDYSLLVAKVSLNKYEMSALFGKHHRKNSEIEYFSMIGVERETLHKDNTNEEKEEDDEFEDEDSKKENLKKTSIVKKIIRYEKDKIGPLKKYFFPSLKGDILYIIAIIDFFQQYNLNKVLETKFKLLKSGVKERDISSVPPEKYKDRFIEFVKSITDIENYVKDLNNPNNKNEDENE